MLNSQRSRNVFTKATISMIVVGILSGCTVYQSSDRESFNSNALKGAPAALMLTSAGQPRCESLDQLAVLNDSPLSLQDRDEAVYFRKLSSSTTSPSKSPSKWPSKWQLQIARQKSHAANQSNATVCSFEFFETRENSVTQGRPLSEWVQLSRKFLVDFSRSKSADL